MREEKWWVMRRRRGTCGEDRGGQDLRDEKKAARGVRSVGCGSAKESDFGGKTRSLTSSSVPSRSVASEGEPEKRKRRKSARRSRPPRKRRTQEVTKRLKPSDQRGRRMKKAEHQMEKSV